MPNTINMDLGKATLRRSGINILAHALHPKYGLAWTDGSSVYLTQVRIKEELLEGEDSLKLGHFECVQSLHWSCDTGSACYLCVVHETMVTLWKVTGVTPELSLKQVRKINAIPVPQGVLWNPVRDLVCILNRDRASFYFKHCQTKGSYALPPIESGKITCGCWSLDGKKLLVGIGSIISIYQWIDVAKSVSEYTLIAWRIPSVEGCLTTLAALSNTWMVCTAEVPLESFCRSANANTFQRPDSTSDYSEPASSLFNIQRCGQMRPQCTAQLVMFEVPYSQKEPRKIAAVPLPTVVCPDLIHYESNLRRVTVGSNAQPVLQVFQVTDTQLWKLQDIRLDSDDRPKGLCGFTSLRNSVHPEGVLVMIASAVHCSDATFLPISNRVLYHLVLTFRPFHNPDLAVLENLVSNAGGDSMNNAVDSPYPSGDNIFRELHRPSSNTRVHLLRIKPLGHNFSKSKVSDVHRGTLNSVASADTELSHSVVPLSGQELELLLPGSKAMVRKDVNPTGILIMDTAGEESGTELEIDGVSFQDQMPNFVNTLEKITSPSSLMHGCPGTWGGDCRRQEDSHQIGDIPLITGSGSCNSPLITGSGSCNSPLITESGPTNSPLITGSGSFTSPLITGSVSCKGTRSRSSGEDAMSTETVSTSGAETQRSGSHESRRSSAHGPISVELPRQVATLQTQLSAQGEQIARINDRIDYIARLLEESVLVTSTEYHQRSCPELVHVVLEPLQDNELTVKKTFVLDSNRLQLEPVKQTFGLRTVEIIIDGVASVVGSNIDGYIPIRFLPDDIVYITGQRVTD